MLTLTTETSVPPLALLAPATKRCKTCKERKTLHDFARHNGARDGRRRTCRECLLAGRYQPYIETPHVRARRAKRESKPKWQRSHRKALARHAERFPIVVQAAKAVRAAVRAGLLVKAKRCQVKGCKSRKCIEAHHWSYAPEHRLDVLWCCAAHHRQGHAQGFILPADGIASHYGIIPELTAAEEMPSADSRKAAQADLENRHSLSKGDFDGGGKKQCRECREYQSLSEFPCNSKAPDGRIAKCMKCIRQAAQRYRESAEKRRNSRNAVKTGVRADA